tara:strand:+ start:78 stop:743 length:666 start_codon:yes stop_codon:yes gene_type:complete
MKSLNLAPYLTAWLAYWLGIMGVVSFILKPIGFTYNENAAVLCAFYFISTIVGVRIFSFNEYYRKIHRPQRQVCLIFCLCIVFAVVPIIYFKYYPLLSTFLGDIIRSKILFPLFQFDTQLTKLFDILFQQALIFCLVNYLKNKYTALKSVGIFSVIFFVLHLPLFIVFQVNALVFILPSFVAGGILAYLLIRYRYGLIYSILLHMSYYICFGVLLRSYKFL